MDSKRLFKKGELTETPTGERMIVSEDGTAYGATNAMISIWNSFDGNTVEEVAADLALSTNRRPEEFFEAVNQVVSELEKADLLQGEL